MPNACMQELDNCNILMEMAQILGREEFIAELKTERDLLKKVINEKLWNEETGFYYDLWKNGKHNMVRHIGAFWALGELTLICEARRSGDEKPQITLVSNVPVELEIIWGMSETMFLTTPVCI